jgi:hypothetical protein
MTLKTSWRLLAVLLICVLAVPPPALSWPVAPQAQEKEQKEQEKEEGKGDDVEEEPKTPADKAMKEEWEKKGCPAADVKFKTETDKSRHPMAEASKDKATVYVVRPTKWGNKVQTKMAVDGKWMGVNRGNNYFFFALDPGEHYFCSKAENRSVLKLKVEAGKTYYLQQKVKMGFMKARNQVVQIDEEQGKVALGKTHPSTWEEKQ